uniref:Uncharacterized protein n=1 Tax=Chromera velia CCMP2878 TaxID=1169474 RepID=A0A0G4F5R4_9ALVE|eukprot:Cvel_15369.t1-p1 / transcript=Cvel_15369.t1 / gene=Cvel_15369 / organism=Chromera_velia_CCMP2878 / gene_product=hypothetical protein / transcript_product=hypothetical protein / location=Cvel_scaffold1133:12527-13822(-) / protein_length=432 / sequence_SO=supercontig / SO=protein_coding / is_pseudo=false
MSSSLELTESQQYVQGTDKLGSVRGSQKGWNMSARDRLEVEFSAKQLVRVAIKPSEGFRGLEEPVVPLPDSAKADMALRPVGSTENWWLAVQFKSRTRRDAVNKPKWRFRISKEEYTGIVVLCVSLERQETSAQPAALLTKSLPVDPQPMNDPRVWAFSGSHIGTNSGNVSITLGGQKYDTKESRCSLDRSDIRGTFLGDWLLRIFEEAAAAGGKAANGVRLWTFQELERQISREKWVERKTLKSFQPLFDEAGLKIDQAEDASAPYDIIARLPSCQDFKVLRIQLKTSYWRDASLFGPIAHVNSYRLRCGQGEPYHSTDFDIFLVGPPRAEEGESTEWKSGYFFLFNAADFAQIGLSKSDLYSGVMGFYADFSRAPYPDSLKARPSRLSELRKWRYDIKCRSSLKSAALYLRIALESAGPEPTFRSNDLSC